MAPGGPSDSIRVTHAQRKGRARQRRRVVTGAKGRNGRYGASGAGAAGQRADQCKGLQAGGSASAPPAGSTPRSRQDRLPGRWGTSTGTDRPRPGSLAAALRPGRGVPRGAQMKLLGEPAAVTSTTSGAMGMRVSTANTTSAAASARRRSLTPLTSSWMYCSAGWKEGGSNGGGGPRRRWGRVAAGASQQRSRGPEGERGAGGGRPSLSLSLYLSLFLSPLGSPAVRWQMSTYSPKGSASEDPSRPSPSPTYDSRLLTLRLVRPKADCAGWEWTGHSGGGERAAAATLSACTPA